MYNKFLTILKNTFKIKKYTFYNLIKRIFDIIFSIIGIILLIPIIIFVKIFYLCNGDFDKIFFKQERIGKNNKMFKLFKFRTMVPNADEELEKLLSKNKKLAKEYKKYKKLNNDPRITKAGKIIRKLSLDEWPQFINILLGDMTLVGPRPYLPKEEIDMNGFKSKIITIKPGLTGYWQVNKTCKTDFKERLLMDEIYISKRNIILDIKIIIKTFYKMLNNDN